MAPVTRSWWLRAIDAWRAWPLRSKIHALALPLIVAAAVAHNAVLWTWYIEDAAISFAFAEHLALGEGLVAYDGGERVEGYSNPTWVLLLAVFELLGAPSEASARYIQVVLAGLTIPVVYLLGREAAPREDTDVPLFAAALLAGSAQFAIWGSSGLENGLFNLLLAIALWRTAVEVRAGGWPWSAFWFFLVAISRPEAILYAAVGGFCALIFQLHARRGLGPTLKWLITFFLPFGVWHAWRYTYFAWPWPNTYYAKLGDHRDPKPFAWDRAGWKYVREWGRDTKMGYFLPVLFLGLTGGRDWRAIVGITAATAAGVAILLGSDQRLLLPVVLAFTYAIFYASVRSQSGKPHPVIPWSGLALVGAFVGVAELLRAQGGESKIAAPTWITLSPPYLLLAALVLLPLTSRGRGWQARAACWGMVGVTTFFACYALGDWMKGFRWLSLATVPGAVLLAAGAHAVGDATQIVLGRVEDRWGPWGWVASLAVVASVIPPNVAHTRWFDAHRETSPYHVKARVEFKNRVRERLHLEGPITDLDVDQGAHVYWSDHRMLDIAGLVDVPLAHNKFQRKFVQEYLFVEEKPHFAHVHGGWASSSKIPTHAEWRRDYVEIPGYPAAKNQLHPGNFIRRDLMMDTRWDGGEPVRFGELVSLLGWSIPSPVAARGRKFYLEVGVDLVRTLKKTEAFRIVAFLSDGERLAAWDLPPGHDWLMPHEWRSEELFHGRFSLQLPEDLPEGTYDLGFVVFGPDGLVLPADRAADAPRYAVGEARFADAIQLVSPERLLKEAAADLSDAMLHAAANQCDDAARAWWLARMHHPKASAWADEHRPTVNEALANCWTRRSLADPDQAVEHLAQARRWDHRSASLRARAEPVAARRYEAGLAARDAGDWEGAYRAFQDVLRVDPSWAWARRYAEEARAYRLGFDAETKAKEEADRQRRLDDVKRRQGARAADLEALEDDDVPPPAGPDATVDELPAERAAGPE